MTGCKKEDIELCVVSSGNAFSGGIIPCCFCMDYTNVLVLTIGGDLIYSTTHQGRTTKCPLVDARGKSVVEVSIGPNAIGISNYTPVKINCHTYMRPVRVGTLSALPTGLSAKLGEIIEAKLANQADGLEAIVLSALPTGLSAKLLKIIETNSANQADGLEAIVPAYNQGSGNANVHLWGGPTESAAVVVPVMVMERGGGGEKSLGEQIKELQKLHAQGVLTDKEFADAKAKVIK